jgi:hypothetical protein
MIHFNRMIFRIKAYNFYLKASFYFKLIRKTSEWAKVFKLRFQNSIKILFEKSSIRLNLV